MATPLGKRQYAITEARTVCSDQLRSRCNVCKVQGGQTHHQTFNHYWHVSISSFCWVHYGQILPKIHLQLDNPPRVPNFKSEHHVRIVIPTFHGRRSTHLRQATSQKTTKSSRKRCRCVEQADAKSQFASGVDSREVENLPLSSASSPTNCTHE